MERLQERFEEIDEANRLAGSYDAYIKARVQGEESLEKLHDSVRGIIWVKDTETSIILSKERS